MSGRFFLYLVVGMTLLAGGDAACAEQEAPPQNGKVSVAIGDPGHGETRLFTPGAGKSESFRDCAQCPEMVVAPAGSFLMGSSKDEPGRDEGETRHKVTIRNPFAVGKYAVTFAEWDACAAEGGVQWLQAKR